MLQLIYALKKHKNVTYFLNGDKNFKFILNSLDYGNGKRLVIANWRVRCTQVIKDNC
jgi:predicted Rossmann-fold nucleotide-binding protein